MTTIYGLVLVVEKVHVWMGCMKRCEACDVQSGCFAELLSGLSLVMICETLLKQTAQCFSVNTINKKSRAFSMRLRLCSANLFYFKEETK